MTWLLHTTVSTALFLLALLALCIWLPLRLTQAIVVPAVELVEAVAVACMWKAGF